MTGLLTKDFKLMKNQRNFFLGIVIFGFSMLLVRTETYVYFATSYLVFIFAIFTMSTISYDEFDNGMSFLMALPVRRKDYVREKFLFGFLLVTGVWVLVAGATLLSLTFQNPVVDITEWAAVEVLYLLMILLFVAVSLPLHLKFGPEKGRMVMFGMLGGVALVFVLLSKVWPGTGAKLANAFNWLMEEHTRMAIGGLVAGVLILIGISYLISVRIMEKRQF